MAGENLVTGLAIARADHAAHTCHLIANYKTYFADGTRVAIVVGAIGSEWHTVIIPSDSLTPPPAHTTMSLDLGEYAMPPTGMVDLTGYATNVPGDPHGSAWYTTRIFYNDLAEQSFWQGIGQGAGRSVAPMLVGLIAVVVVLLALFKGPQVLRRLLHRGVCD